MNAWREKLEELLEPLANAANVFDSLGSGCENNNANAYTDGPFWRGHVYLTIGDLRLARELLDEMRRAK